MTRPSAGQPSRRLAPFDVVLITAGIPQHGVAPGSHAVILEVHEDPHPAYEVEVADGDGRTIFVGAVDPAQVEELWTEERDKT